MMDVRSGSGVPALPVVLAAVFRARSILLIRRAKPPFAGLWGLPGGKVHRGEHLDEAVEREVLEESGVRARFRELRGVVTELMEPESGPAMHYVLLVCRLEARAARTQHSEEGEVAWFGPAGFRQLRDQVIPSDLAILERLVLGRPGEIYYRCRVRERAGRYSVTMFK